MYHDQGLTPFRVLAVDGGVSFTAGLPVVRTSTTHGTGYDIANKNVADPEAMRHAIYLAIDILNNRNRQD
jgi:4-hydroxythreonine-4-phosphate dehydrogenase